MAETLVREVDGTLWFRICQDCGFKQSEDWKPNNVCQNCGGEAILSTPQNSGYEHIEL